MNAPRVLTRVLLPAALALAIAEAASAAGRHELAGGTQRAQQALRSHALRTLEGRPVSIAALQGEVVVVNFWASWCPPCRRELPRLDALNASIARQGGRVLAVSIDDEARTAERFVRKHKLALPVCHDGPDGLARQLDLPAVPFTLVLDRSGVIAYTTSQSDPAALDQLDAVTRRLLTATAPVVSRGEGGTR